MFANLGGNILVVCWIVDDDIIILSCGYDGTVCGWSWKEMHAYATTMLPQSDCALLTPKFRVQVPKAEKDDGETAINAIGVDEMHKRIFAGVWCVSCLNNVIEWPVEQMNHQRYPDQANQGS